MENEINTAALAVCKNICQIFKAETGESISFSPPHKSERANVITLEFYIEDLSFGWGIKLSIDFVLKWEYIAIARSAVYKQIVDAYKKKISA
ncbi:hypothetical protein MUK70_11915 [Dyadobacter chenwenxiniae]|uniref:Uncharacterized protein n=1 Tax=Dyadobacter chenwenxiniae TaxID=2906456 RepID=A0A9X1PFW1_9BACT|nr:hypothetical protein [Dyadobacter chenwenxiniae]MCF0059948.1 hypothetical protein [Dyadobacter chenwenxiniae]UON85687.1 hypothetical protein MUK70_11915 [Dyadobacter chenwenxiniae]